MGLWTLFLHDTEGYKETRMGILYFYRTAAVHFDQNNARNF